MREITIRPITNGFLVTVGCATVAFHSIDALTVQLSAYLHDPETVEKQYLNTEHAHRLWSRSTGKRLRAPAEEMCGTVNLRTPPSCEESS